MARRPMFRGSMGRKAGISQIVGATINGGKSAPAESEKTNTYELGLKSVLLDRSLVINADIYVQNVRNYIQPLYYYDEAQTLANNDGKLAYTSGLGNVPKVQSKGVELDLAYSGIRYTTIRFAGAYNDARYKDFRFLAKPAELAADATPYYDVTGRTLPGGTKIHFQYLRRICPTGTDRQEFSRQHQLSLHQQFQ